MIKVDTLSEKQKVIYEIVFSKDINFNIDMNWCDDLFVLLEFIEDIESELKLTKLSIIEQTLILTLETLKWIIRIDRKNE